MKSPFNSYDEHDRRVTVTGATSTRMADESLLYNLRFAHPELADISDAQLINYYDEFAISDWFGDNDSRFVEWVRSYNA